MRFSDRIGVTTPPNVLLLDQISVPLRNSLWNFLLHNFFADQYYSQAVDTIAERFFKLLLDALPYGGGADAGKGWLRRYLFNDSTPWYDIYNLLEFIVSNGEDLRPHTNAMRLDRTVPALNKILEEEMSGYRFVGGTLIPISDASEVAEIATALNQSDALGLNGVHSHIKASVSLISRKPEPDYRNSIKESISAVESLVKRITGTAGGGLEKALSKLDDTVHFHAALKAGILKLYGYTSDAEGIRHAILDETTVGFDEAKFMLVSCSALVNFLISKAVTHGIICPE